MDILNEAKAEVAKIEEEVKTVVGEVVHAVEDAMGLGDNNVGQESAQPVASDSDTGKEADAAPASSDPAA